MERSLLICGPLLLRDVDLQLGLMKTVSAVVDDFHRADMVQHSVTYRKY